MAVVRIGTMEILASRIYSLDAESHDLNRSTVVVEPGHYDLYSDGMTTFWLMRGNLNLRGFERLGDGIFAMRGWDEASSKIEVQFPSRRFGMDEWAELLAGLEFAEGQPTQRLRVHLLVSS